MCQTGADWERKVAVENNLKVDYTVSGSKLAVVWVGKTISCYFVELPTGAPVTSDGSLSSVPVTSAEPTVTISPTLVAILQ